MKRFFTVCLSLLLCVSLQVPVCLCAAVGDDQVLTAALEVIGYNEGSYDSVNANDNGALSIGKLQWHASRALTLMQAIVAKDPAAAEQILGAAFYREVTTARDAAWNARTLTAAEEAVIRKFLGTQASIDAQDETARIDVGSYLSHGKSLGITSPVALVYFSDLENQYGYGGAEQLIAKIKAKLGKTTVDSLTELHTTLGQVTSAYADRRTRTYLTCDALNWENDTTFVDVPAGAFYTDAVRWAVEQEITEGTGNGRFSPDQNCTRGQIVTFLWRSAGQPKPMGTDTPFTDVTPGAYYYDAMLWAVEQGITKGTTQTAFSPNAVCTRGQAVTFLHRAVGAPDAESSVSFGDVEPGAYYYDAVRWAVEQKITTGVDAAAFAPDRNCTRGHIVTFLYRSRNDVG